MSNKLIILSFILLFYGCSSWEACIRKHVNSFTSVTGFDYFDYATNFETFLLEQRIIEDISRDSYITLFKKQKFCDINYEVLSTRLDNSFSTSPTIGDAYIDCDAKYSALNSLNFDSIAVNPINHIVGLLNELSPRQFREKEVKLFFVYQINVLMTSCN